jgi:cytoskeletal protein CcmA (bactofilin family)
MKCHQGHSAFLHNSNQILTEITINSILIEGIFILSEVVTTRQIRINSIEPVVWTANGSEIRMKAGILEKVTVGKPFSRQQNVQFPGVNPASNNSSSAVFRARGHSI